MCGLKFSCWLPWGLRRDFFLIVDTPPPTTFSLFSVFVTCDPSEAKISKRHCSLKTAFHFFKRLLNFILNGSHKSTLFDFLKLSFRFLQPFSIIHDPVGARKIQNPSRPSNGFELFQTSSKCCSQWSSLKCCFIVKFCKFTF